MICFKDFNVQRLLCNNCGQWHGTCSQCGTDANTQSTCAVCSTTYKFYCSKCGTDVHHKCVHCRSSEDITELLKVFHIRGFFVSIYI